MRVRTRRLKMVFLASLLILGIGLFPMAQNARAEIDQLVIGIGVDADTLNPHEQTTSLFMNICELIFDTLVYQTQDAIHFLWFGL